MSHLDRKIKVLIAKPGLDGHDRGARVIAQGLRDAGMEVTYTGIRKRPDQILDAAIRANVDCVGLSCLSGAHNTLFPEVVRLLKERGAGNVLVIGGGIIPDRDIPYLLSQGIAKIFTPGTRTADVAAYIRERLSERRNAVCLQDASV